jgi:hypothetical protein
VCGTPASPVNPSRGGAGRRFCISSALPFGVAFDRLTPSHALPFPSRTPSSWLVSGCCPASVRRCRHRAPCQAMTASSTHCAVEGLGGGRVGNTAPARPADSGSKHCLADAPAPAPPAAADSRRAGTHVRAVCAARAQQRVEVVTVRERHAVMQHAHLSATNQNVVRTTRPTRHSSGGGAGVGDGAIFLPVHQRPFYPPRASAYSAAPARGSWSGWGV